MRKKLSSYANTMSVAKTSEYKLMKIIRKLKKMTFDSEDVAI